MQTIDDWLNQPGGLADRLRRLRQNAGLTGDQLAARLEWTRSKIPKIENGRQMPSDADILAWAQACGSPGATPGLVALAAEGRVVHREWRHRLRGGQAAVQAAFDDLVRPASHIRSFQILLVPGLLQTPAYTRCRALEAARTHGTDPARVEEVVAARMRRQEVLYDTGKTFEFLITEAALRYLLCPPDVMRGQLDRLLSVTGLGNVTFGILPFGRQMTIVPMVGFLMADEVTVVETFTGEDTLLGDESAQYAGFMDAMMAEAATGEDARALIISAAATSADRGTAGGATATCGPCLPYHGPQA